MLDKERSVLRQVERIFKSQFHVIARQDVLHEIGGRNATGCASSIGRRHATFRRQAHGEAASIQATDMLFFVRSQKGCARRVGYNINNDGDRETKK